MKGMKGRHGFAGCDLHVTWPSSAVQLALAGRNCQASFKLECKDHHIGGNDVPRAFFL
jgi:hypothetical protein